MFRWDLINYYIKKYNFKYFLEIGTFKGELFNKIEIENKISVDPEKTTNASYHLKSNDFFKINKNTFDIIFIDGFHEKNQVNLDIKNALNCLNKGGVIVMHDCHPDSEQCQRSCLEYDGLFYLGGGNWTGDCWKAFVKNRAELPYEMYVWDEDWGCGVIDTNIKKISDTSALPTDMEKMTYEDFVNHPEWMNFKKNML